MAPISPASSCIDAAYPVAAIAFVVGAVLSFIYLMRAYRLSFATTLLVLMGHKRVARDKILTALMILTLFVPIGIVIFYVERCN